MASDSEAAISAVSQFLADENTNPEDRLALFAFLKARPKYSKPTSYISDIEQRLELLREIQQRCKKQIDDLDSTTGIWSALMIAPLERLRFYRDSSDIILFLMLKCIAIDMPMLFKVFLAKNPSKEELILAHVSQHSSVPSHPSSGVDKLNLDRNRGESKKCEQRDKFCVVTGAANPDICYIFPFAAKKNPGRISSIISIYTVLWGEQVAKRLRDLLIGDGDIIDTTSNMVALEPLLHRWWGKAIFGFEPIEKIEKGIRLRVRWLSHTTLKIKDKIALDVNPLKYLQPYLDSSGGYVGISDSRTHRPIIDGTIIDITATDSSAVPSWDLFSLQWDLIRMASLCGAAEASDDDDWESDDDEEAQSTKVARTMDWILDSPITLQATPGLHPLRSLPVRSQESSPIMSSQSQESSLKPRGSSTMSRESSPAKSLRGRVDENNRW